MNCPHCSAFLRFGESIPEALVGAYVYVQCPHARCGKEMVAALHPAGSALMTFRDARRAARAFVKPTAHWEWALASVVSGLTVFLGLFLCLWQFLTPPQAGQSSTVAMIVFALTGPFVAFVLLGGFYLDAMIGRDRWLATLARAKLVLATEPEAYRA